MIAKFFPAARNILAVCAISLASCNSNAPQAVDSRSVNVEGMEVKLGKLENGDIIAVYDPVFAWPIHIFDKGGDGRAEYAFGYVGTDFPTYIERGLRSDQKRIYETAFAKAGFGGQNAEN